MTNHPNRRPRGGIAPPPELLRELRDGALLTQTQAAQLVHATLKTWQAWEYGQRRMPLAAMELFVLSLIAPRQPCAPVAYGDWVRDWVRPELVALVRPQERAPARRSDMQAFAADLRRDPAAARAFFQSAGILNAEGELTQAYRDAVD